jgi:hypothetical protein
MIARIGSFFRAHIMEFLADLHAWIMGLDAQFAFLLALPFLVGAAGLCTLVFEGRRRARSRAPAPFAFEPRAHRSAHGH